MPLSSRWIWNRPWLTKDIHIWIIDYRVHRLAHHEQPWLPLLRKHYRNSPAAFLDRVDNVDRVTRCGRGRPKQHVFHAGRGCRFTEVAEGTRAFDWEHDTREDVLDLVFDIRTRLRNGVVRLGRAGSATPAEVAEGLGRLPTLGLLGCEFETLPQDVSWGGTYATYE